MAANGGYRVFNTGDVLTAAQVQYYLQNQTVMYFATTTARDAVLTGATLVEGMVSYTPATGLVVYNGSAWTSAGTASPLTTKGDVWGYSTTNARVPVGTDGTVLTADSTQALGVKWSAASGGTTWTGRKAPAASTTQVMSIAYNGSNLYVAVMNDGTLYSSADALTWTSRTSGFGANPIKTVFYGNGLFVAAGANGTLTTSTDGITWTARTSQFGTGQISDVEYANSLWVAVGQTGAGVANISTSTDGITWTARTITGTIGTDLYSVAYGNGYWVVTAQNTTNNYAYSTNGTTWTAAATGSASNQNWVLYVNGYWITGYGSTGNIKYQASIPTGSWTTAGSAPVGTSNSTNRIAIYNNKLYFIDFGTYASGQIPFQFIGSATVGFTSSARFDFMGTPIQLPISSTDQPDFSALFMNSSNGQMIIGDSYGRIFTSF